jgi:ABC-type uncharacterized transport system involved in gliding motility auxiliary subunit
MSNKLKKSDLSITIILIIGIAVVLNYFAYQLFIRWDLTDGDIYSISDASKRTARELDDIVNIKAYFSEELPTQYAVVKQQAVDLLQEYENYGSGKIRLEFIDPQGDEKLERELYNLGIPQLTFDVISKDQRQLLNGYLGVAVSFGDKVEIVPAIRRDTSDLEYQITTAIKKVVADKIATIGYLTSQGSADPDSETRTAFQGLSEIYSIEKVELSEESPSISPVVDTLVILNPREQFNEAQLEAINSFLKRGGALFLAINGVNIENGLMASKNSTGLETLLEKYGLKVNQDLVADVRAGVASFTQGFFTFSSNYAYWPKLTNEAFNKDNGAVSSLENVLLPWASSVEIDESKLGADSYKYLAFTTDRAWRVTDNFDVTPDNANKPQGTVGAYNLMVSVNGEISDPYASEESMPVKIVVVGDADFIQDGFVGGNPDNLIAFQNLVDSLSLDEDLISIRSKGASSRPIREISDSARNAYKFGNIFGVTVLVLAFGMVRYFLRRKSRFADDF